MEFGIGGGLGLVAGGLHEVLARPCAGVVRHHR